MPTTRTKASRLGGMGVARLRPDGRPDRAFGSDGVADAVMGFRGTPAAIHAV